MLAALHGVVALLTPRNTALAARWQAAWKPLILGHMLQADIATT
jgi:hypothetical protein